MIERHVTFHVFPEKTLEFKRFFTEKYRPAMSTMPGFVRVELLVDHEQSFQYQMMIRFESMEAALDWRNSPTHQALQPELKGLYGESTLKVYEVVA